MIIYTAHDVLWTDCKVAAIHKRDNDLDLFLVECFDRYGGSPTAQFERETIEVCKKLVEERYGQVEWREPEANDG